MNRDKAEKERQLTPAEKRRVEHFRAVTEEMISRGYRENDLTVSLVKANVVIMIAAIPVTILVIMLYVHFNGAPQIEVSSGFGEIILFFAVFFALIIIHELIHGIVWAVFSEDHFRDIEFGVILKYGAAYCTCRRPLKKYQYIIGGIMPLIVLGIVPVIYGITAGSFFITFMGLFMTLCAGGDVMILLQILMFRTDARDVVIYDHPVQAGCVVFTRN
jgi:hypothetical protein